MVSTAVPASNSAFNRPGQIEQPTLLLSLDDVQNQSRPFKRQRVNSSTSANGSLKNHMKGAIQSPPPSTPTRNSSYLAKPLSSAERELLPNEWKHLIDDDGYISEVALRAGGVIKCYHGCNQSFKTWKSAAEHMGWLPKSFDSAAKSGILSPDAFPSNQVICTKMPAVYAYPFSDHLHVSECNFDWSDNGSNYLHGQNPKANWRTGIWSEIVYHTLIGSLGFACRCGRRFPSPYHAASHLLFGHCPNRALTMLEWSLIAVKAPGQGTTKDYKPKLFPSPVTPALPISVHIKIWRQGIIDQSILCSQQAQNDQVAVYIDRHSSSSARQKWEEESANIIASHGRAFKSQETVLRMHVKDLASAYAMSHPNQPGFSKPIGLGPFCHPLHTKADRMRLRWALVMSCAAWDFLKTGSENDRVVIMAQDSWTLCPALLAGVCAVEDVQVHIGITMRDVKDALTGSDAQ